MTAIDQSDKIELEKMLITTLNKEKGAELMTSLAQSWKEEGIEIGEKRGEARGETKGIERTAINMLKQNLDIKLIASVTGMSTDELLKLQSKI